jgi:hypothetical protein
MLTIIRATALALGFSMAGVGMYASYMAYAGGGYLMIAAPLVALAAALIPAYAECAFNARQYARALALTLVWLPCFGMVVLNAIERNHAAKAGGEAERAAFHTAVNRAAAELVEAKATATAATTIANKLRAGDGPKARSAKATETAAREQVQAAEKALHAAEGAAVTESATKAPEWLLPLALEVASMFLIACGFGLGRRTRPVQAEVAKPAARAKDPKRVAAGRKAAATRAARKNVAAGVAAGKVRKIR